MSFGTREPAVVDYVRDDDERCLTNYVGLKGPSGGWGQAFGGLALDVEHLECWKQSLCDLFEVSSMDELVGRNCFVLRCWDGWGSDIEGLEVDGRRFTITDFRRIHWPTQTKTQLENARDRLRRDIDFHARRIREDVQRLETVANGYVDWSTDTSGTEGGPGAR